jgi:hypothetical protein
MADRRSIPQIPCATPGGPPPDGRAVRRCIASAGVSCSPCAGMSENRSGGPSATPGMPCRTCRNAARAFRDANLAVLQAQVPLPSLADLRADAGDKRATDIWASSTARSCGSARTWRHSRDMSCRRCPAPLSGGLPADGRAIRRRVASAGVSCPPFASIGGNRRPEVVLRSAAAEMPCRTSCNAARRPFCGTLIWYLFRHKVGCLRLRVVGPAPAISAVFAFGRAVHRGSTARREHGPAARACCLLRTGIPLTLAPSAPLAFGRAVRRVRAERHKHGAADCACRLWAGLLASLSPACGFCRASARVGTEVLGSSPAAARHECRATFLALPLVAHSTTLIRRLLQAQGSGLPGDRPGTGSIAARAIPAASAA